MRVPLPTLTKRDIALVAYFIIISLPFAFLMRAVTRADVSDYGILITEIGLLLFVLIWWLLIDTFLFDREHHQPEK